MSQEPKASGAEKTDLREGVFSRGLRGSTLGVVLSVGAVAFESLGVATILPTVADELGGLGGYGWALSALMLANIVGTVVAGADIDRRGPTRTVLWGSLVFATGCMLGGFAPDWGVFVVARVLQGLGVGAIMAYAYGIVGIAYPSRLQPVMFALLSSAWTIPSLLGPVFAGIVTEAVDWRVVFWAVAPVTLILLPLVLPSARAVSDRRAYAAPVTDGVKLPAVGRTHRIPTAVWFSIALAVATSAVLFGLELDSLPMLLLVVVVGLAVTMVSLRRVLPAGTLRVRRGAPAGIVIRFLLCAVYFGSEAFLPLGLTSIHSLDVHSPVSALPPAR